MKAFTPTTMGISPKQASGYIARGKRAYRFPQNTQLQQERKHYMQTTCDVREIYGFLPQDADILTAPKGNLKLMKSVVPAYGLSLHHFVIKLSDGSVWNLCPNAGDCTKLCVSENGKGGSDHTQRARRWRTELLILHPEAFFFKLGYEIERAISLRLRALSDGGADTTEVAPIILLRPNTFSDIEWEKVSPGLVDGTVFGDDLMNMGYTKNLDILNGDGWLTPYYRVAYSLNENSNPYKVEDFLDAGGSVSVVTDRYYTSNTRQAVEQWDHRYLIVDADQTDEWVFQSGVIGDLAYKPRTKKLRAWGQYTDFVVKVYGMAGRMATLKDAKLAAEVKGMLAGVTPVNVPTRR